MEVYEQMIEFPFRKKLLQEKKLALFSTKIVVLFPDCHKNVNVHKQT